MTELACRLQRISRELSLLLGDGLPLPDGAATESRQEEMIALLEGLSGFSGAPAQSERGEYSAFGEEETVSPYPLVQVDFVYGIISGLGTPETFGSGTASKAVGSPRLLLRTGAAANSWARYYTYRYLKYRSGQGIGVRFSRLFSVGVAGSIQISGALYIENQSNVPVVIDGYAFGFNGATFGILHANNSVLNWTPRTAFNVDPLDGTGPSGMVLDPTKLNLYQIKYPFLGTGTVFFFVEKPSGGMTLVHAIEYPNSSTDTQLNNPNLRLQSLVYNSTNTTNLTLSEGTNFGWLSGNRRLLGPKRVFEQLKTGVGTTEVFMFAIRCNTTINGLTNRSQLHLRRVSGANTGNNAIRVKIYKNATITGASFTNIDANNSISATDTAATFTTAGELIHVLNLASNTNSVEDVESFDDILNPGEVWVVTAIGGATNQVPQVALTWIEDI